MSIDKLQACGVFLMLLWVVGWLAWDLVTS
jgi:hypothetical protein